jgi:hypothetical protein
MMVFAAWLLKYAVNAVLKFAVETEEDLEEMDILIRLPVIEEQSRYCFCSSFKKLK